MAEPNVEDDSEEQAQHKAGKPQVTQLGISFGIQKDLEPLALSLPRDVNSYEL